MIPSFIGVFIVIFVTALVVDRMIKFFDSLGPKEIVCHPKKVEVKIFIGGNSPITYYQTGEHKINIAKDLIAWFNGEGEDDIWYGNDIDGDFYINRKHISRISIKDLPCQPQKK